MSPYDSGQFVPRAILNYGRLIERLGPRPILISASLAKLYAVIVSDDNGDLNEARYRGKFERPRESETLRTCYIPIINSKELTLPINFRRIEAIVVKYRRRQRYVLSYVSIFFFLIIFEVMFECPILVQYISFSIVHSATVYRLLGKYINIDLYCI